MDGWMDGWDGMAHRKKKNRWFCFCWDLVKETDRQARKQEMMPSDMPSHSVRPVRRYLVSSSSSEEGVLPFS